MASKVQVIRRGRELDEADPDEVDYHIPTFAQTMGTHVNSIPIQTAVAAPRLFYGARFVNQAQPQENPDTPWVQNLSGNGKSFDEDYGELVGAIRAKGDGVVKAVTDSHLLLTGADGKETKIGLFKNLPYNRKSGLTQTPTVKAGDVIKAGALLARSNFTDKNGAMAMGLNARIAMVPFRGHTMDDAAAVSESFAKRMRSEHLYGYGHDDDETSRRGKTHFTSLFPTRFKKEQIDLLDDDGVVLPGTVVKPNDPLILATKPKSVSSAAQLGTLSRTLRDARSDNATIWDNDVEGVVTDVAKTKNGPRVYVKAIQPSRLGDKIVIRPGQKGIISAIIPDNQMPTTEDGKPMDMLLNQLGLPSRVNPNTVYEALLGKIAEKTGKPYIIPSVLPRGTKWHDFVRGELDKHGMTDKERIYDPAIGKFLERPVTVGNTYVLKLHHVASSKVSSRSQGSYDINEQPSKGSGEAAQSKRLSGLEINGLASAGAYNFLRQGSTLGGQKNADYWKAVRQGNTPAEPGTPFVFQKFRALLSGAGFRTKDMGNGVLRLGPMTDKDLEAHKPKEIETHEALDPRTIEPISGGVFDKELVATNSWGKITLPHALPNPAFEDSLRKMLGLTKNEFRDVLARKRRIDGSLIETTLTDH